MYETISDGMTPEEIKQRLERMRETLLTNTAMATAATILSDQTVKEIARLEEGGQGERRLSDPKNKQLRSELLVEVTDQVVERMTGGEVRLSERTMREARRLSEGHADVYSTASLLEKAVEPAAGPGVKARARKVKLAPQR